MMTGVIIHELFNQGMPLFETHWFTGDRALPDALGAEAGSAAIWPASPNARDWLAPESKHRSSGDHSPWLN